MQFIPSGPDIPDALLRAHEEGRLVFFCGAGISYPAGLPGFKGLVEKIYKINGTDFTDIEREAFNRGQFDATLNLLEQRLPGQRLAVRRALAQALTPKLRRRGAIETQAALLRLGRDREGVLRLVTTNFDHVFHTAAMRTGQAFEAYAAPMLPIPKNSRWDGLVFLHGLLPRKPNEADLKRLVVTSGDFGLAYLTERWAARFVSELFRGYVVCFVGYSINDPVLRYMMDALAADRRLGESLPRAWALADCESGQERHTITEWEAKGVTPILYEVPAGSHNHSALHKTLHNWSEIYRDGVLGKEHVVVDYALAKPSASTPQDDFVGRMLWALSDKSGLPAKRFAEFNPVPSLDWLEAFSDERFKHDDLVRFGVPPHDEVDHKLHFSLIRRPAPYNRTPSMSLVSWGTTSCVWDDVMFQLAQWLVRHLDDPRLVIWIAQRGGQLDDRLPWLIEQELDRFAALERDGNTRKLEEIRSQAPRAIPSPLMRKVWRLLLSGRVKSPRHDPDLYSWKAKFKRDGLSATLRLELRELLSPQIVLKEPFRWSDAPDDGKQTRIKQLVDWELALTANYVHSALRDVADDRWISVLPQLLMDFQQLLLDALDLLKELGEADDRQDRSHWDLTSISPHWQNRGFHDWVSLIELLRDAWLAVRGIDGAKAARIAQVWFDLPYSTFKRLALFAASQDACIAPEQWIEWLLVDRAWWLWSTDTGREVFRLIALQGSQLTGTVKDRLQAAILAGPPREMFKGDLEPAEWNELVSHSVWLRLAKLKSSGGELGASAKARLIDLSQAHPNWRLAADESDEFSHWMSGTGDPDFEERRKIETAPRKRSELVAWLRKTPTAIRPFYEDTWHEVCRTRFFHSVCALCDLAKNGEWPSERWREALQAWSEEAMVARSWRYAAPLVQAIPDTVIREIVHSVTWWIESASKAVIEHNDILLDLCRRILSLPLESESSVKGGDGEPLGEPVMEAINHPIGHVTQALLNLWFQSNPNDDDQLPPDIEPIFTKICDVRVPRFRHGRVLLGSRLIALFRVDRQWTERHLLVLFNWSNAVEAKAVWEGFLWSPRLYQPLLIAFKPQFLECANHYEDLGKHARQFAAFLTYAAVGPIESYTVEELRAAIGALPQEGLEESAQAISQAVEGAGEQREDYWKNRIQPFWHSIWPKSRDLATPRIAEALVRMIIAARSEFSKAFAAVEDWLQPIEYPHYVVQLLSKSNLCMRFPADALRLLNLVIRDQPWIFGELADCLDQISRAEPTLSSDPAYQRLRQHARKRGG